MATVSHPSILREKADQATLLLRELGIDAWMTIVRETDSHPDPGIELVGGVDLTWVSALLVTARGERLAIVGRLDIPNLAATGVFPEILGYDQDVRGPLHEALRRLDPARIALNFSTDDHTADGLTLGLYRLLTETLLAGTPWVDRLTSAAPLLAGLRGRKSPTEIDLLRQAIAETEEVLGGIGDLLQVGVSERQVARAIHAAFHARGLEPAWPAATCPLVNVGPESEAGHGAPRDDLRITHGHVIHVDLGVRREGYCSDLQRTWYVRRPGETAAPEHVSRAFATVLRAIQAAAAVLGPGALGWDVDRAARSVVTDAGYPEYPHGTGHGLGRAVHDGGTLLGPRWPKYGGLVERPVEAGNVFTLELGVMTESGPVGLEEDVLVTPHGCEYLSTPQRELWLI